MTIIKICRVKDIHTARLCGDLGVQMIGLHGIHGLSSSCTLNFLKIASELHKFYPGTVPVLVTKVTDAASVAQMLSATGIEWVQVHAPLDGQAAETLLHGITAVLGRRPGYIATVAVDDPFAISRVRDLRQLADYILVDVSYRGGTGRRADNDTLRQILREAKPAVRLVAGGLTVDNVTEVLVDLMPGGVDIQSGLEARLPGRPKDPVRLTQFVRTVREASGHSQSAELAVSHRRSLVSLAVTSVPNEQIDSVLKRFRRTDIDLVHVDFSDNSAAPRFFAEPFLALERLAKLVPCLPYDVHLFVKDIGEQANTLRKCVEGNVLLRVALTHYTRYENFSVEQFDDFASLAMELGVGIGIAIQATGFSIAELDSILRRLDSYPLKEVSLITRSRAHRLEDVAKYDLSLLSNLASWASKKRQPLFVSVDRDMNLSKLAVLSPGLPSHLVVGATLLASKRPQRTISAFRRLLKPPIHVSRC